ncbi:DUF2585 family protein [Chelativorans xinjiangense]|uniref:DUF2585 family protein n=1 Tax=Chelativorans xinjiangense TaxID=2681485 RepID=UPI0013590FB2|nr:DUF2585 family protein [Chelativorans xinjiangense]
MSAWQSGAPKWSTRISFKANLLVGAGFIMLQGLVLLAMGQPAICECGYVRFWSGAVLGPENSQQLTDWYTYTHVIHGLAFYLLLWLMAPASPIGLRFALAVGLEAGWEVFENTPLIINRYREAALAQGYFGDSVINSVSDTVASVGGFVLARTLPVWTIGVLNIIQLIYPSKAISNWQVGG